MDRYILSDEREKHTSKNSLPSAALIQILRGYQKLYRQEKKKKLKEFNIIKPALLQMLKEFL